MRIRKICYVVTIPTTIRSFFMSQLQYLAKHGFDVSVICARDEKLLEDMGNGIHYIPTDIPRGISFGGSIKAVKELINIFKREKFDLIQYSTQFWQHYTHLLLPKLWGAKSVTTI